MPRLDALRKSWYPDYGKKADEINQGASLFDLFPERKQAVNHG